MEKDELNALEGIQGLISAHIKGFIFNEDIVEIANQSGLTNYIPKQLESYGSSDFNYDADVYNLLVKSYEKEDKKTIENLFQNINDNIKKYQCCKRFQRDKCKLPKENFWKEKICEDCNNYIDNGLRGILGKHFKTLGFNLDDEGFIQYEGRDTFDIDQLVTDIAKETSFDIVEELMPEDIILKGKSMSEIYIFLYCIENSLRLFIEDVFVDKFGDEYIDKINISTKIKQNIENRKNDEKNNKWLSLRGGNELFYTDFDELGNLIQNNWVLFEKYFPNQNWIIGKIQEISKCRNLVAHNSFVRKDERDLIRVYYKNIMKQIYETKL